MSDLKSHIYNWLIELEEEHAAKFLDNCTINQHYIDTAFSMDNDFETYIYEVTINVPLKIHRKLAEYSNEISAIESALNESGQADCVYFRNINWKPYLKTEHQNQVDKKAVVITEILTQDYVNKQIRLMNNSIESNSPLALGISKELIETCCKHILNQNGIKFSKDWDIGKLVKETNKYINLIPFEIENQELAKSSIAKILGGLSNIVHGITELRNSYGTGHGHSPEFKPLDEIYVKLAVSASSELAIFYLRLNEQDRIRAADNRGFASGGLK
ncbi:MAG TPA: abortive infection family protein [Daejeonella sp.]|nr:abortive infection family protein [Daejeonella sp.]